MESIYLESKNEIVEVSLDTVVVAELYTVTTKGLQANRFEKIATVKEIIETVESWNEEPHGNEEDFNTWHVDFIELLND